MNKFLLAIGISLQLFFLHAQESQSKLSIGDIAPSLSYGKWIKGNPITDFEKDHVYVFEFWATWCGPCIAAMPHLSDLADKYKGTATFVGVNVWEKVKDKSYESSYPAVEKFVEHSNDRMRYSVVLDNNAQDMANKWMVASGQGGIPSTFIVKNNIIQWIGHPIKIDSVIDKIIDNSYDMAAFKASFEKQASESEDFRTKLSAGFKNIRTLVDDKKVDEGIEALEKMVKNYPQMVMILGIEKFRIIYENKSEKEAFTYADSLVAQHKDAAISLAATILESPRTGSAEAYTRGARYLIEQDYQYSGISDYISKSYEKAGNKEKAIKYAQEAVDKAKLEINQEEFAGRVIPETIAEYEKRRAELKLRK